MKLDEFANKLGTVGDDKLMKMLDAVRREGPEIALPLVEAEARRRGLVPVTPQRTQADAESDSPVPTPMSAEADERVRSAFAGLEKPLVHEDAPLEAPPQGEPSPGAWLTEEMSKSRLPLPVKLVATLGALGGLVFFLFKYLQK
jgi:hypothetical protein